MKSNLIPIIPHSSCSLLKEETKEFVKINNIAKKNIFNKNVVKEKMKELKIESLKDFYIYITRTDIYFVRYKKANKKNK